MDRASLILAAFFPASTATHTPVQVQKLLFLIQSKIPVLNKCGFNFEAYDYGPFDKTIYIELDQLIENRLVDVSIQRVRKYALTPDGLVKAKNIFEQLDPNSRDVIGQLSSFVRSLSFAQLVSSVYKAYPEMKVNSVFKE